MTIEIKNLPDFKQISQEVKDDLKKNFDKALETAAREIVERSKQQRDVRGSTFKSLTPQYSKYKTSKGRRAVPDLTFSGKMLGAITSKVQDLGKQLLGKIFFTSAAEAAKAQGNMKTRDFFGLSESQVQKITDTIK